MPAISRRSCEETGCQRDTTSYLCTEPSHRWHQDEDERATPYPATDKCKAVCDWHASTPAWQASHPDPPNRPARWERQR